MSPFTNTMRTYTISIYIDDHVVNVSDRSVLGEVLPASEAPGGARPWETKANERQTRCGLATPDRSPGAPVSSTCDSRFRSSSGRLRIRAIRMTEVESLQASQHKVYTSLLDRIG